MRPAEFNPLEEAHLEQLGYKIKSDPIEHAYKYVGCGMFSITGGKTEKFLIQYLFLAVDGTPQIWNSEEASSIEEVPWAENRLFKDIHNSTCIALNERIGYVGYG